jgi:uncharacterized protein with ParB-like and HNH nuclease domain
MQINSKDLNLFQLLSIQSEQFVIPSYQRRYAWGPNQIAALFEDIDMLRENDGHLFGMLILHSSANQGVNRAELVDGQQRMTTISLLLAAIRNRYHKLDNQSKVDEIDRMLYYKGYDDIAKSKLILGELDNADYQKLLKGDNIGVANPNLNYAYEWFSSKISDKDKDWLNRFYYKFVNVAKIIRLDVGMAKDAYKLFETINNRGLRLSPTDLLKNFILGHAAKIGESTLDETKDLWSKIIISLDQINTDDFFRQYMCGILTRKVPKSKLVEEFKKYYLKNVKQTELLGEFSYYSDWDKTEEDDDLDNEEPDNIVDTGEKPDNRILITEFLNKIVLASSCYRKIVFQGFKSTKINRRLKNLASILSTPTNIYLMFYMQSDSAENEKLEILRIFEVFMLRRHICNKRTSENDNIFAKLLRIVDSENLIQEIKTNLQEDYPEDIDFEDNFCKHDFVSMLIPRAKYVLSEIEYSKRGNTGEFTLNSGNEVHLEHIIPEKIKPNNWKKKFGDWEAYLGEYSAFKHKKYVSKIGNMTLLAGELNISASNNPFDAKKAAYMKSDIVLTQELFSEYPEFKFDQVETRGKELTDLAMKIWKI